MTTGPFGRTVVATRGEARAPAPENWNMRSTECLLIVVILNVPYAACSMPIFAEALSLSLQRIHWLVRLKTVS